MGGLCSQSVRIYRELFHSKANTKMTKTQERQDKAVREFQQHFEVHEATCFYAIIRERSRSGMRRYIDFFIADPKPMAGHPVRLLWVSKYIADILGMRYNEKKEGLEVN